jgi:hypothetical protein
MEVAFDLAIDFATASGRRGFARVGEGRVFGRLNGTVAPQGGDWPVIRPDNVIEIDSRYMLQLDDGALVYLRNRGYLRGSAEAMSAIGRGEAVAPGEVYFRCAPQFDAASGPHHWLTSTIFVGIGECAGKSIAIDFHEVL